MIFKVAIKYENEVKILSYLKNVSTNYVEGCGRDRHLLDACYVQVCQNG